MGLIYVLWRDLVNLLIKLMLSFLRKVIISCTPTTYLAAYYLSFLVIMNFKTLILGFEERQLQVDVESQHYFIPVLMLRF